MPIPRLNPVVKPTAATVSPPATSPLSRAERLASRTLPYRCVLLSVLFAVVGAGLMNLLLPLLPAETLAAILTAHLPTASASPALVHLRLFAVRLPMYALLALAGLTRFSGGLTSAVLAFRALADGSTLCLLFLLARGSISLPVTVTPPLLTALSPQLLFVVYGLWVVIDGMGRHLLAVAARRVSHALSRADGTTVNPVPPLRDPRLFPLLWRYPATVLISLCVACVGCGIWAYAIL